MTRLAGHKHYFDIDDPMFFLKFYRDPTWLPGTILKIHGRLTFEIQLLDGMVTYGDIILIIFVIRRLVDMTILFNPDEFDAGIPMSISDSKTPASLRNA